MANVELLNAINFAAKMHVNQRRKDANQSPFINHPIGVATILGQAGVTKNEILMAAVLHDVVEDTDATITDLQSAFGYEVAEIVAEVTDDQSLSKEEMQRAQVTSAPNKSDGAKLIKMADKLYNMRDTALTGPPISWSTQKAMDYCKFCKEVVDAIAESDFDEPTTGPIIADLKRQFDRAYDDAYRGLNVEILSISDQ